MDYRLENLSEDDFEELVCVLCQEILGIGTVAFSKGKDGGRDARFEGTANAYPSTISPWAGKFIIQAKHTTDYNASCSDKPFYGNDSCLINKEIKNAIKPLKTNGEIDNYLLFTNRKETESREKAVTHIKSETGLTNVDIIGKATIHTWLSQNENIAKRFKIGKYDLPLVLNEFDIKEVISAFGQQVSVVRQMQTITEENLIINIHKIQKNQINNLSVEYYENQIRRKSQIYFQDIDNFLSDFKNDEYATIYYNFADELGNKIEVKRTTFNKFEEIFVYLYDIIFEQNRLDLGKDRRLIWIFLHHLYFNCHIGRTV